MAGVRWYVNMIYFDNAATTQLIFYRTPEYPTNPSSPHMLGILSERLLKESREKLSAILDVNPNEIYFTSGGTESNNIALQGFVNANIRKKPIIGITLGLHPSVIEPIKWLESKGMCTTRMLDEKTYVDLACINHVNQETGDIFDMNIIKQIKKVNENAKIFVDGAQGFAKESIKLNNIDMYSFSGHKIHAPLGIGGLIIKNMTRILPITLGGGQESGLRSGTENIPGIAKLTEAATYLFENIKEFHANAVEINNELRELADISPKTYINSPITASPYILNISFLGIKPEVLVHMLSQEKIYISTGSACKSRKKSKTILEEMGFSKEIAKTAVRFSFSHLNTIQEAKTVKSVIIKAVQTLRGLQ